MQKILWLTYNTETYCQSSKNVELLPTATHPWFHHVFHRAALLWISGPHILRVARRYAPWALPLIEVILEFKG